MPARFRVEWTESASTDFAEIVRYIARDSPANARQVHLRIRKHVKTLTRFPGRGHTVPELINLQLLSYREISVPPFRIIYRIDKQKVFVIAVLDARRDIKQVLAERLLRGKN